MITEWNHNISELAKEDAQNFESWVVNADEEERDGNAHNSVAVCSPSSVGSGLGGIEA